MDRLDMLVWDYTEDQFINHSDKTIKELQSNRYRIFPSIGVRDKNRKIIYEGSKIHFKPRKGYEYIGTKGWIEVLYASYGVSNGIDSYMLIYAEEDSIEITGHIMDGKTDQRRRKY